MVTLGEQLIADVYNCVRASKLWTKTLLIITYDEHGGCYDHCPPPAAVPPAAVPPAPPKPGQVFAFDRYGVRVPAVIVSPYVQPGSRLRPPAAVPFDHTSIIATLRKRYPQLGGPLTARDAAAPDLESVLTLTSPDNRGPPRIKALPYAPTPATAAAAHVQPLNSNQRALVDLAANLPQAPGADLQTHMASLKAKVAEAPDEMKADARTASAYVKQQVGNFFRSV